MKYREIVDGIFLDRPNRFIAHVDVNGTAETVHVKNTGRCKELLLPGAAVRLEVSDNPKRRTKYDLVAVHKQELGWVNMDSQAPNKVVGEWLSKQEFDLTPGAIHPGCRCRNKRFFHTEVQKILPHAGAYSCRRLRSGLHEQHPRQPRRYRY